MQLDFVTQRWQIPAGRPGGGRSILRTVLQRKPSSAPLPFRMAVACTVTALILVYDAANMVGSARIGPADLAYARIYPVCAARWIAAAPHPVKIFNQYGEGGYLAYTLSDTGDRVFIFGDAALMGDDLLNQYREVETIRPNWDNILTNAQTDVVLFDTHTPVANVVAQSPRWSLVYSDPKTVIYARADKAKALALTMSPDVNGARANVCSTLMTQGLGT